MKIDGVFVFLSVDLQDLDEEKVRYYLGIAKARYKADKVTEMHLFKDGRGKIKMNCFVEAKGILAV